MIDIHKLEKTDIGKSVCYTDSHTGNKEYGTITSWNSTYVFVDYKGNGHGYATNPIALDYETPVETVGS